MSKPTIFLTNTDIDFLQRPVRIEGTKHHLIGTTKDRACIMYLTKDGSSSSFDVEKPANVYVTKKAIRNCFTGTVSVAKAFKSMRRCAWKNPDDYIAVDVTLDTSLPELFRTHKLR